MIAVNLIPPEARRRQAVRRRLRMWTPVVLAMTAVAVLPFIAEARLRSQARELSSQLIRLDDTLRGVRREVTTTAAAVQEMESRIARAKTLRTKRSWAGLLAAVARCMPEEVWLTSLATEPSASSAGGSRAQRAPGGTDAANTSSPAASPPPVVELEAATRLQLTGFALNHERLYDLMSRLKDAGAFPTVELVKAGVEPVLDGRAVKFVLACGW